MASGRKRILVAVDGSEQAFEAVRYVARVLPPDEVQVVLLHVVTKVPESFWDLEKQPAYHYRIVDIQEWEAQQEKAVQEFMLQARALLLQAGLPEEAVEVIVQPRRTDTALDIIAESRKGYDAVVVGRRGLSELKDLVLGNIANKLVEKLHSVPLWIVGGKPETRRVLLCVDDSEGARRVVEHVAGMMSSSPDVEVTLFHVIMSPTFLESLLQGTPQPNGKTSGEKERRSHRSELAAAFEGVRDILIASGMDPGRVHIKVVSGVSSRAGAIVEEAREEDYGTIAVGRRGLSKVQEFLMGRVSSKVIQLARDRAIWVVS